MFRKAMAAILALIMTAAFAGCAKNNQPSPSPAVSSPPSAAPSLSPEKSPEKAAKAARELTEELRLKVYVVADGQVKEMGMEEYLEGVLAGEMRNDWPLEALKAQAIIARTFAMKFLDDKGKSKYEGADISTDIEEAQAYNAKDVNDLIKQAIEETRGEVITYEGEPIYTWFHSHAAGQTALAVEGLEYEGGDQPYIKSVESTESAEAPDDAKEWTAKFTDQEIIAAASELGLTVSDAASIKISKSGDSGRVTAFDIGGVSVPAASFRIKIGSEKLRSTMIDKITASGGSVTFTGRGYGHGVGMSQWGAYEMAENGASAQEIIEHYYADIDIEKFWD